MGKSKGVTTQHRMTSRYNTKVEGRVFAEPSSPHGGNPLTIFVIQNGPVSDESSEAKNGIYSSLAQLCSWESVMIHNMESDAMVKLFFYLPSGQSVNYCAHAAIGACAYIGRAKKLSLVSFIRGSDNECIETAKINSDGVTLCIDNKLEEKCVGLAVVEQLMALVGIDIAHVVTSSEDTFPSILNSSVGRSKTLVMVRTLQSLHSATNPTNSILFRDLCDSIESTGLYLYAASNQTVDFLGRSFECRQFPRYSGYPEDPATGIAASALASSLYKRGMGADYEFFQGTAMNRRSRILVSINQESGLLNCSGLVLFDSEVVVVI